MADIYLNYTEHEATLAKTFVSFFEREDFLDVVFICKGNRRVKANQLVLSTVSPFLKRIFAECKTTQNEIILSVPDIDHNILKLVLSFIYEGTMKLSKEELTHFKAILKLLDIKLPGAVIDEQLIQTLPTSGPPPAVEIDMGKKLQYRIQRKNTPRNYNIDISTNPTTEPTSNRVAQREESEETPASSSNTVPEETNVTRPGNAQSSFTAEDDDPLNVPDFYFVPAAARNSAAQAQGSAANNDGSSEGTSQSPSTTSLAVQQEGGSVSNHRPSAGNSSKQKSGSSTRKRSHAQMAEPDQNSVETPVTVKIEREEKEMGSKRKEPPVAHVQPLNVSETANQRSKTRKT